MEAMTNRNIDKRKIVDIRKHYNLNKEFNEEELISPIITNNEKMKSILETAKKVSKVATTVLVTGESGTGKELIARQIHQNSNRKDEGFVAVNCGAIPNELIESVLFGHTKGSFTGAMENKIGKFEYADKGTLFLDEIGDLPLNMQVKLLRVIQEKEIEKVGSNERIKVDIKIISATNKDLLDMVNTGLFREDLYYRLNVIPINIPPLRERSEDIELLINHFNERISDKLGLKRLDFKEEAKLCLKSYQWPGNIRELENIIESLIVLCQNEEIDISRLPQKILENNENIKYKDNLLEDRFQGEILKWKEYEKQIITRALIKHKSFNKAAKVLGITHSTVANKARKYNIEV
ncbi:MAG: sigma-54 interaction domain-containing protein [Senegalia sp. (in: firmicutes)]|uniref:sigma-54 interaction domain-containing protein n=1 Tax=Senegalia sp. (in: firmicutes) TaxID=1924098 RepID=UPI003F98C750